MLDLSALATVTQLNEWDVNAILGGEIKLNGLTSLSVTQNISITDYGGSKIVDPNLTTLTNYFVIFSFYTDGTDASVANAWTSFVGGTLSVTGGSWTLPNLTDIDLSSLRVSNGGQLRCRD